MPQLSTLEFTDNFFKLLREKNLKENEIQNLIEVFELTHKYKQLSGITNRNALFSLMQELNILNETFFIKLVKATKVVMPKALH